MKQQRETAMFSHEDMRWHTLAVIGGVGDGIDEWNWRVEHLGERLRLAEARAEAPEYSERRHVSEFEARHKTIS